MTTQEEKKEFWAIVSLLGHNQLAGFLDEYTMGGCSFLRLTVPETSKQPSWSRLFKDNAIYSIDPCTEAVAKWKAESLNIAPMTIWDANTMLEKNLALQGKVIVSKSELPEGFSAAQEVKAVSSHYGTNDDDNDIYDDERPF
ncbi:hypothetical protein FEM33_15605 [Dyadobacter flavalbus]|uniref:Uncharacterized protein n=1 Tax=Dyadobacter flavalbus TaxID=2579942 RepID=A0A5M8QVK4_9BACT|nr:hypothetical protein [Dyadobacter flavalbus]KAA6438844.1 hypothetical protein FEM33_15605 [Dyadobacter flavalbus]